MNQPKNEKAIIEILKSKSKTDKDLMKTKRRIAKKYAIGIPQNSEIIKVYKNLLESGELKKNETLERLLRKRAIRTMSGIAPVAVLTMPYPCPGNCAFCPTEKDVPQSYLSNEPAVMRAIRCGYNPSEQVHYRLRALVANGHNPEKIELIVIGGTWSYLPEKYKFWFILNCFAAANQFKNQKTKMKNEKYNSKLKISGLKKDLKKEQRKNEKAKYKIIGLTLETRPDYIDEKELWQMRELGCTRVELGVQAIDDEILKKNKRGHGVARIAEATKMLRDFGFKITYHLMPGLPGATPAKDEKMFKQLFSDTRFQPDQIKFYPTVVTKGSLMYRWWKQGKYKPYTTKQLEKIIIKCKKAVPTYVRIIRLIRDIPGESIEAGNKVTNLRQIMKDRGVECNCIRCREARGADLKLTPTKGIQTNLDLKIIKYPTTSGQEYFISFESKDKKTLYGFVRLQLPSSEESDSSQVRSRTPHLAKTAIIRELHVYGELTSIGKSGKVQHVGLGKKLMQEAEKITKDNNYKKLSVISGVGVRGYYRKLGFRLKDTYMIKNF